MVYIALIGYELSTSEMVYWLYLLHEWRSILK